MGNVQVGKDEMGGQKSTMRKRDAEEGKKEEKGSALKKDAGKDKKEEDEALPDAQQGV